MKNENLFRIFYDRVYEYFTYSIARKVFFFTLVAILLVSIYLQFWDSTYFTCLLLLLAAICSFATLVDSIQNKRAFMEQLHSIEADYANRVLEKEGEKGISLLGRKRAFSTEELYYMRKKKREYNYMIAVKVVFVIFFVVLFVNML